MVAELEEVQIMDTTARTEYVCGFMMDEAGRVALIKKLRPSWQRGKMNGIGGHVEPNESPNSAMVREFFEETGYSTTITQWWPFAILTGENFVVHFFSTYGNLDKLVSATDEEVVVLPISEVTAQNSIPNLMWLIPMARSIVHESASLFEIRER